MTSALRPTLALRALALALAVAAPAFAADPPGPVRTILQRAPVSGAPGEEVIVATVVFPAGAALGYHTHMGEEVGVVTSGTLLLQIDGQPPLRLHAGDSFVAPRGVRHRASAPDGEARVVATYVVDKDKPLVTLAP